MSAVEQTIRFPAVPAAAPPEAASRRSRRRVEARAEDDRCAVADRVPAPTGLQIFDLGMVPASVTPPATWRRAAWFVVASSAAALGGLVTVTSMLSDNDRSTQGHPVASGDVPHSSPGTAAPVHAARPVPQTADSRAKPVGAHPVRLAADKQPPVGSARRCEHPTCRADLARLSWSGAAFYRAVGRGDLHRAFTLTTGDLHAQGYPAFLRRFRGVTALEPLRLHVDRDGRTAIARIMVHRRGGPPLVEERELALQPASSTPVRAERLLSAHEVRRGKTHSE